MTSSNMNCEAFDAALPDCLEGTLDDSRRAREPMCHRPLPIAERLE